MSEPGRTHWTAGGAALVAALAVAACGTPAPAPRLYHLRTAAPVAAPPAPAQSMPVWELASDVALPAYLDRESLVLVGADSRLRLLDGQRWAEPLRDTLPRLLRHDLALLRGASSVWLAPAPPGVGVARRLHVELLALQASGERGAVLLQARWWFSPPRDMAAAAAGTGAGTAVQALTAELQVPVADLGDGASIAAAHRAALWQLAERIARQP